MMDLANMFLNLVAPPAAFFTLLFILPPLYLSKFFLSLLSSLSPEDMTDKVVLITGASSGIGEQVAYEYAKRGAVLVLIARREGSLREVADRAMDLGSPDVFVMPADVAKPEDCRRFVDATIERYGRLDHLVVNAGVSHMGLFDEINDVTHLKPVMEINFWGSVYPVHRALPHLKRSRGRIVANASAAGWNPYPRMTFYNASKAALINFFETLRIELGNAVGITIVTPGWIESEIARGKTLSDEGKMQVDQEVRDIQVGMFPVEYADACAKAMVDGACRGARCVTTPAWFGVVRLWRVLASEVLDWCLRMVFVRNPDINKGVLDMSGLKNLLYPSTIQTPMIKRD